jgi:single-stranded DNA-binding protein
VPTEEAPALISIIAFDPAAVRALLALGKGDAIAVTGRGAIKTWEKNGERRAGLSVVAEGVLSAYQLEKPAQRARRSPVDQGARLTVLEGPQTVRAVTAGGPDA